MGTLFFLRVFGTELNGGGAWDGLGTVGIRAGAEYIGNDLGLNVVALQKKVIGFLSVTPTTILVGSFTRRIKKLDVSHHSQVILQLSSFCGSDNQDGQLICFVNQEGLVSCWAGVCSLRYECVWDIEFT